jgi:hypothetical protein
LVRSFWQGVPYEVPESFKQSAGAGESECGGLFLAFPAIFPASATLIEKHEKKKKEFLGLKGEARGRSAASIDAAGSSMGSIGLFIFALFVWQFIARDRAWIVLGVATVLWLGVSVAYLADSKGTVEHDRKHRGFKPVDCTFFVKVERVAFIEEPERWRELLKAFADSLQIRSAGN